VRLALQIASLRSARASILTVMRATAVFLGVAAVFASLVALILSGGVDEARIEPLAAQVVMWGSVGVAAAGIVFIGRGGFGLLAGGALAVWLFRVTMRRMLVAAAVGPVGLFVSWYSADRVWVIYGAGAAVVLISLVGPTTRRLQAWQEEAADGVSVLEALLLPYR
jgi:hypothetical protein